MCILLFDYEVLVQLNPFETAGMKFKYISLFLGKYPFLIGIGNQTVPFVAGIGIIWDHILLIHPHEHQNQTNHLRTNWIKSQPLALGALGKQCEL